MISQQAKLQQRLGVGTRAFLGLLDQGVGCDVQIVCSDGVVEVLFQVFSDVSSLSIFRGTVCFSPSPVDLFSQAVQGHENWLCSPSSHGEEEQRFIDCAFSVVGERFLMSGETSHSNISFPKGHCCVQCGGVFRLERALVFGQVVANSCFGCVAEPNGKE